MIRFRIVPANPTFPPYQIFAHDAGAVLYIVERMNCRSADVERDGAYAFSVGLDEGGVWRIF